MMKMRAAVIDKFGDANEFRVSKIPIPQTNEKQVLIKLEYAGVGSWDIFEREGGYAEILGITPTFPYILGSEGSGTIVSVGENVTQFKSGDRVAAAGFLNPSGGFYAEYVTVDENLVTHIPSSYSKREASVILGVGITALRGLIYTLNLQSNEKICIVGASGGIGHIAVQIAKSIGAHVFAIVAGKDGGELISQYDINKTCDGYDINVYSLLYEREFDSFDKALILAGGAISDEICNRVKPDGVIAYPSGVFPEPKRSNGGVINFNGEPDQDIINHLTKLIEQTGIRPYISREFSLEDAALAHSYIQNHHLGKALLRID